MHQDHDHRICRQKYFGGSRSWPTLWGATAARHRHVEIKWFVFRRGRGMDTRRDKNSGLSLSRVALDTYTARQHKKSGLDWRFERFVVVSALGALTEMFGPDAAHRKTRFPH